MTARRLLVVEDSKVIQRLIEVCLRPADIEVSFRDDGLAGLAAAIETAPDGVVLDVGLPEMDGWQVLSEIKRRPETSHIEVLLLTASADDEARRRAAEYGARVLAKPFAPDDLRRAVTEITAPREQAEPAASSESPAA